MVPVLDYVMAMEAIMKRITITLLITFGLALAGSAEASMFSRKGECGIKVVSFQVSGTAGDTFTYAGKAWTIPAHGSIEVLAKKNVGTITVSQQPFDLSDRTPNPMGIVSINLNELQGDRQPVRTASAR